MTREEVIESIKSTYGRAIAYTARDEEERTEWYAELEAVLKWIEKGGA